MSNSYMDYGDLRVTMTSQFTWVWNDKGTKGTRAGTVWQPVGQQGLLPLGSVGFGDYQDYNGKWAVLLVGNVPGKTTGGKPACAHPVDYQQVWTDKGSGGNYDLAIWRPIAPAGYVVLGDLGNGSYNKPPLTWVYCLRADYVTDAKFKNYAWYDDRGTGADYNVCCWDVVPTSHSNTGEYVPVRVDTFFAKGGRHEEAPDAALARMPQLYVAKNMDEFHAPVPKFTYETLPRTGQEFNSKDETAVSLPFSAYFLPTDLRSLNSITNPFVQVSRACCWHVSGVYENGGAGSYDKSWEVVYGITKERSQQMSETTGVSITSESGVSVGPFNAGMSMSLNHQMTYSSSSSVSEFSSKTVTEKFNVPAKTCTVMFSRRIFYQTKRADGTQIIANVAIDATDDVHFGGCPIPASKQT